MRMAGFPLAVKETCQVQWIHFVLPIQPGAENLSRFHAK